MEYLIDAALVSAVLILLMKWREAERKLRDRGSAPLPDPDTISQTLIRLEKKVDRLAFRYQGTVPAEAVTTRNLPEADKPATTVEASPTPSPIAIDAPVIPAFAAASP